MRVLLSGYTCDPNGGSESANTWYTAVELARAGVEVHLLTRDSGRQRLASAGAVPGLNVTYLSDHVPGTRGQMGVYAKYVRFQRSVRAWTREHPGWDVGHHVSWGSINHPVGLAGSVPHLVVGPVGGGQQLRPELAMWLDGSRSWNRTRNAALRVGSRANPWSREIAKHADVLYVANWDTRELARILGARRVELMLPEGVRGDVTGVREIDDYKVVWLGRLLPIKAAGLALAAFRHTLHQLPQAQLVFVGDGPCAGTLRAQAEDLVRAGSVRFTGNVPWVEGQRELANAHAHLFTSIRDSSSAQTLEAAAMGVPTVGLRIGGLASVEDGQAIVLVDPVPGRELAAALGQRLTDVLLDHDADRRSMAARAFASRETFAAKVNRYLAAYGV